MTNALILTFPYILSRCPKFWQRFVIDTEELWMSSNTELDKHISITEYSRIRLRDEFNAIICLDENLIYKTVTFDSTESMSYFILRWS